MEHGVPVIYSLSGLLLASGLLTYLTRKPMPIYVTKPVELTEKTKKTRNKKRLHGWQPYLMPNGTVVLKADKSYVDSVFHSVAGLSQNKASNGWR